ncbi:ATP-dependent metallopeptidase FtsH/Yme1/Tma family protein [Oenococcus sicerae]|uniref:ATP-dependent zinc metalloprotease FtsH n=1 Tax=Oenococcus sicerae TaxID=2203724 RepID=UPI0010B79423|nr:ATP-dependent zinc metalloprotease FtsH {ECO:0000255/HAMAP-Rule:MF_01458} [Oenococcus sicerae]
MQNKNGGFFRSSLSYALVILAVIFIIYSFFGRSNGNVKQLSTTSFLKQLKDNKIKDFTIQPGSSGVYTVAGDYKKAQKSSKSNSNSVSLLSGYQSSITKFSAYVLPNDASLKEITTAAKKANVAVNPKPAPSDFWGSMLTVLLPTLIMFGLLYWLMIGGQRGGQGGQGGGPGGIMSFGRSKAKPADPKQNKVRFADVAGEEEEKQELVEVVEFLKDPKKFTSLGARIPKGVLLEGPPGTGKTLLAKAVAGEAGVPFFSISGSDFVEMFVGVGASRVRDLFETAKKSAPSIIFIDEIDAVGRRRGAGMGGGNDEREQTLNQILIEMDGFEGNEGVIVLASTNRSDVLDPALLRSGRFDRKILVGAPDVKGREAILRVHSKNKPLADDVDLKVIAQQTPGFVGADLENLLNEAALLAARGDQKKVTAADIDEAEDRVIAGPAKKDRKTTEIERHTVAYHEAGHAIVGLVLNDAQVVRKVTIVPRGRAGGYALMMPKDERYLMTEKDAKEELAGLMGGRAAEILIYHQASSGASNDFQQATQIAREMVTQYGMSDKLGMVQLEGNSNAFIGDPNNPNAAYSQKTSELIDDEVRRLTNEAYQTAVNIIKSNVEAHKAIAEALLKYETLDEAQIKSLYETGSVSGDLVKANEAPAHPMSYEESKAASKKNAAVDNKEAVEEVKTDQDDSVAAPKKTVPKTKKTTKPRKTTSKSTKATTKKSASTKDSEKK